MTITRTRRKFIRKRFSYSVDKWGIKGMILRYLFPKYFWRQK